MGSTGDCVRTVLVTGGSGFIGSNFVRLLLRERPGVRVVNMDALTYAATPRNLEGVCEGPRYAFVRADVRDVAAVADVFARFSPDAVVHFAAESHVDRSIADPLLFQEVNAYGTAVLLEAARAAWSQQGGFATGRMFVHVSTDEVYGDLPLAPAEGAFDDSLARAARFEEGGKCCDGSSSCDVASCPASAHSQVAGRQTRGPVRQIRQAWQPDAFREDDALRPRSPYAASKAAADMTVQAYGHTYGMPAVVLRCSNNYGPRQHPEKLVPKAISCALGKRALPVYGDGRNVRDWLYVEDCCRGILAAMEKGRAGEAYNLGGACPLSNARMVEALRRALSDCLQTQGLFLETVRAADRPGHDRRYAMNCEKAASELGWRPKTPLAEGLSTTLAWYLEGESSGV